MNKSERNELVVKNLPLVGYLVSELCARATHLSRDDLASAGALALVTAAQAYNPDLGIPFGAYARTRIVGSFSDELRSQDWAPRSARRRIKDTLAVQESLTAALGRTPTVDEIAEAMGVDRQTAKAGLNDASRVVSTIDDVTSNMLVSGFTSPEESVLSQERAGYLAAAVEALPETMAHIVREIYFHDRTVKDVAAELGITHSAVSQQRAEAIRLIRDGLAHHYADSDSAVAKVESKVSPARRSAYLARFTEHLSVGAITDELKPVAVPTAS